MWNLQNHRTHSGQPSLAAPDVRPASHSGIFCWLPVKLSSWGSSPHDTLLTAANHSIDGYPTDFCRRIFLNGTRCLRRIFFRALWFKLTFFVRMTPYIRE